MRHGTEPNVDLLLIAPERLAALTDQLREEDRAHVVEDEHQQGHPHDGGEGLKEALHDERQLLEDREQPHDPQDAEEAQLQAKLAPPKSAPAPEPETVEKSVASLGPDLLSSIVEASKKTGANSGYLLHIALRESGLVLGAQAPTSSATGPFQFIQGTWYQMLVRLSAPRLAVFSSKK